MSDEAETPTPKRRTRKKPEPKAEGRTVVMEGTTVEGSTGIQIESDVPAAPAETPPVQDAQVIRVDAAMLRKLAKDRMVEVGSVRLKAADDLPPYWKMR